MTANDALTLFTEALEESPGFISMDTVIADVPEWTSLVWLTIMSMLDEKYNVQLSTKEIRSFKTVKDAADLLMAKVEVAG